MSDEEFDVFLSHSHVDAHEVEVLANYLVEKASINVWLDKWVLIPGERFQQHMARGLNQAKSCAVCIGKQTPKGWFREEIERALERQNEDQSFRVIPVLLPDSESQNIDDFLSLRTWVDFRKGLDDNNEFHSLVCGIRGLPPGRIPSKDAIEEKSIQSMRFRKKLKELRVMHQQGEIDTIIVQEFQRKILDKWIEV
jgi:hypothetical protein